MPIPPSLLAHLQRWKKRTIIARHLVEFNGEGVSSVKTAFKHAVTLVKLGSGVSPHTLWHTAATWLMQNDTDPWQAAGYLGMTPKRCCACTGTTTAEDAVAAAKPTASASPQKRAEEKKTNGVKIQ
jgi:integrase